MDESEHQVAVDSACLLQRAAVYRLLGRLWLQEVDADGLRELQSPPLSTAFVAAGGELPETDGAETLEDLAIDYCQLLIGPSGHLPPHQSVWAEGQFHGEVTAGTQAEYAAWQLPQPDRMADHLGEQLRCMAILIERLAAEPTATVESLEAARQFFERHLDWTAELCQLAGARAETNFYRSVFAMTQDFLAAESEAWLASSAEQ